MVPSAPCTRKKELTHSLQRSKTNIKTLKYTRKCFVLPTPYSLSTSAFLAHAVAHVSKLSSIPAANMQLFYTWKCLLPNPEGNTCHHVILLPIYRTKSPVRKPWLWSCFCSIYLSPSVCAVCLLPCCSYSWGFHIYGGVIIGGPGGGKTTPPGGVTYPGSLRTGNYWYRGNAHPCYFLPSERDGEFLSPVFYQVHSSAQMCLYQTPGRRPPRITGRFVNTVIRGWVGAPNERAPFRFHGAVVVFVDRCLSRTRNLAASNYPLAEFSQAGLGPASTQE